VVAPDQFFGIILMLVLRQGTPFETPSDLVVALKEKLTGRVLEKGEEFHVEVLIGVREFWSWLAPIGITLHNAFVSREHIVAPHAFSYKLRQDLSPREKRLLAQEGGRGAQGNDHDVLCVYKTWMHSTDVKVPLLVLPVDRRDRVQTLCPETVVLREPPSNKDATELLNLAMTLEKPQYNLGRAAVALRELVAGHPGAVYQLPPTPWLSEGTTPVRFSADTGSQTFAHLPDTSWNLLVTFHRQ
jgi:hypothetical protein